MAFQATVSSKGQFVIPAELRAKLDIKSGTRLSVEERNGVILIEPSRSMTLLSLRGSLSEYALEDELLTDPIRNRE